MVQAGAVRTGADEGVQVVVGYRVLVMLHEVFEHGVALRRATYRDAIERPFDDEPKRFGHGQDRSLRSRLSRSVLPRKRIFRLV